MSSSRASQTAALTMRSWVDDHAAIGETDALDSLMRRSDELGWRVVRAMASASWNA